MLSPGRSRRRASLEVIAVWTAIFAAGAVLWAALILLGLWLAGLL